MKSPNQDCDGCQLRSRRDFIGGTAALIVWGVMGDGDAAAAPVSEIASVGSSGDTASYPFPDKDGVSIDKREQVIVVRYHGKVMAFPMSCPHENTALRWRQGDLRFQCPKHESKYTPDGTFTSGRATRNMDRFSIKRDGNSLIVEMTKYFQSDKQPAEWASAALAVG